MANKLPDLEPTYVQMQIAGELVDLAHNEDQFIMKVRPTDDGGLVVIVYPGKKHIFTPDAVQIVRAQLRRQAGIYTADEIMARMHPSQHAETGETTAPPETPPHQVSPSPAPAPAKLTRRRRSSPGEGVVAAVGKRKPKPKAP